MERGAHACKASKLGPVERWWTQDGKLGITIQDPSPESRRWTHLLYFTCSYCILSCVWKLAKSLLVLRYHGHLFLFSLILHVTSSRFCLYLQNIYQFTYTFVNTARDVVTVLLIFAKYLSIYLHIFTCTTEAHTHKHTCTISIQEEWRQPGTGVWLREAAERLC